MRSSAWPPIVVLAVVLTIPSRSAAVCVNPGGTSGCFSTIQDAVDDAANGEVVDVAAGTYLGNVVIGAGRALTLQGAGADSTILQGTAPIIEVRGMNTTATLKDLGITGAALERHLVEAVNDPVSLVVEDCIITGNDTMNGTAALSGAAVVRRTVVQGAQTGVVLLPGGTLEDSIVRGNGFGVMVFGGGRGPFRIRRTEVSNGTASGVVIFGGRIRGSITDSTISGNASPGIYVVDRTNLTVERSTIANNGTVQPSCCGTPVPPTAGGIWVSDGKVAVTLRASILANEGSDCAVRDGTLHARFRSTGFNVVQTAACGKAKDTDAVGSDPLLAPLADNGGGSETHALMPGSPAIGRVTKPALCKQPDQRGVLRAVPCDSGAFESP